MHQSDIYWLQLVATSGMTIMSTLMAIYSAANMAKGDTAFGAIAGVACATLFGGASLYVANGLNHNMAVGQAIGTVQEERRSSEEQQSAVSEEETTAEDLANEDASKNEEASKSEGGMTI